MNSSSSRSKAPPSILPIEINIKDDKKYLEVAIVVDNLLNDVQKVRKKFNVYHFYKPNEYINFFKKLGEERKIRAFSDEISKIRMNANIDHVFDPVLKKAIVCNVVQDDDYKNTYLDKKLLFNPLLKEYDISHAIVITPESTENDVLTVFSEYKKEIQQARKLGKKDGILKVYKVTQELYKDTKDQIRRDREWYWLKRAGQSYLQIAEGTSYKGKIDATSYRENIKKQIQRYRDFLKNVTI